jgi:hypothetical protein
MIIHAHNYWPGDCHEGAVLVSMERLPIVTPQLNMTINIPSRFR